MKKILRPWALHHCERSEAISTKQEQIATASPRYDVITIDVSNLKSGIYFVKLGSEVAKFVKE